jgi:hypothetical protein
MFGAAVWGVWLIFTWKYKKQLSKIYCLMYILDMYIEDKLISYHRYTEHFYCRYFSYFY